MKLPIPPRIANIAIATLVFALAMTHVTFAQSASETEPSPASPRFGDLSHLTFTATGPLSASLLSPFPGTSSDYPAAIVTVGTVAGAGVELEINGTIVPFEKIGKRTVDTKTGATSYAYYGVPLDEGANRLELTPLGAAGKRGTPFAYTIYGPGRPTNLHATIVGSLRADGRTPALLQIAALDEFGHHALPGTTLHLTIVDGDARFASRGQHNGEEPVAPATGGRESLVQRSVPPNPQSTSSEPALAATQTATQPGDAANYRAIGDLDAPRSTIDLVLEPGGTATAYVVPGLRSGNLKVRVSYRGVATDALAFVNPALRKPIVLGLATAGIGAVPAVPGEGANVPDGASSRTGRIALYATGAINKNAQATVAYDTAARLMQSSNYGSFTDNPQERPYQTFGDASTRRDDALSRDHLYARVEQKKSSATYGEFQAQTGGSDGLGGFNLLVDGAKAELAGNNGKLTLFEARNDIAYSRQVLSPTGLSTLGLLLQSNIVVGSDLITLVALDRRTGAIVSQQSLTRNVDYTLDYATGQLRFINPPLPFDTNFNPQQVLAQYEYAGAGVHAQTIGGRFETGIGKTQRTHVGVGFVNDSTGTGNFSLASEDIGGLLPGGAWSVGHQTSHGVIAASVPTLSLVADAPTGNAYRASLATAAGQNRYQLGFETTTAGYGNPFGGLSSPGLLDYRLAFAHALPARHGEIALGFDHQQNSFGGGFNSQSDASLKIRGDVSGRVSVHGGIDVRSSGGNAFVASALAAPAPSPSPGVARTLANVSRGSAVTQAEFGVDYKISKTIALGVDRIATLGKGRNASQPAQTTAQLSVELAKKGRVYIRQLYADAPTQSFAASTSQYTQVGNATRSTAVGIERALGTNTTVDGEYVIEKTGNGSDIYAASGVKEKLVIGKRLTGDLSLQHASAVGANAAGFDLYGLSLAYAVADRFRATAQYQSRTGSDSGATLDAALAGTLSPSVSAIVTSTSSKTASGFNSVDDRVSLAFRPTGNDRSVALLGYERKDGSVSALGSHTDVLSLEELYRPGHRLELAGRFAYKLDGNRFYPAQTTLLGVRADERIASRVDLAIETRFLRARAIAGASTTGLALEAGYRIGDDLRVAGGYTFSGSPDPALASAPTRRGLYATVTSVIDRLFGWGLER